jgi:SAM-dependent methyltransferase
LAPVEPKPKGWSPEYASVFQDASVVDHYHLRPPYPDEAIEVLARLAGGGSVLDAGCGTGELARRLAIRVTRVDAVDVSAAMLERARRRTGGNASNLRWILGRIEDAPVDPPYALAVAGDSVHWFDWPVAMPRLAGALAPDGVLALVHREWLRDEPVRELLIPVYDRHSWNDDFEPLDVVEELVRRGLFERQGEHVTAPEPWKPTLDEVVGAHFSTSGFAPDRLQDPTAFATELGAVLQQALEPRDGRYDLDVRATIVWGRPDRS